MTSYPDYRSVQGNLLAEKSSTWKWEDVPVPVPAGAVVYVDDAIMTGEQSETCYKVSLRSIGDCDTTVVSKAYGGGGHKNASSFVVSKSVFLSWKV